MIYGIVRQLESIGEGEVAERHHRRTRDGGPEGLDDVAYVRFASVYRDFREAKDFEEMLGELAGMMTSAAPAPREGARRAKRVTAAAGRPRAAAARPPTDERYMRIALALGARDLGITWPNPSVGAVVVDGRAGRRP